MCDNDNLAPTLLSGLDRARMTTMTHCVLALLACAVLAACTTPSQDSFANNPSDSGSRYSEFNLPGSSRGMQNTDLED